MVCYAAKQTDIGAKNTDQDFERGTSRGQGQQGFVGRDEDLALHPEGCVAPRRGLSMEATRLDLYSRKINLVTSWRRNGVGRGEG